MRTSPGPGACRVERSRPRRAASAVLRALRLYGFLAWVYIAANSISHPYTLTLHLTHFASWPHEDTFGAGAFAVSLAAALLLLAVDEPRPSAVDRLARPPHVRAARRSGGAG